MAVCVFRICNKWQGPFSLPPHPEPEDKNHPEFVLAVIHIRAHKNCSVIIPLSAAESHLHNVAYLNCFTHRELEDHLLCCF